MSHRVALLKVPEVAGEGDGAGALRTILVGTEDGSRQGLIPENVFQAMARGEILPLLLLLVGRRRPWPQVTGMGSALVNAFSTSSSSATLPLTFQGTTEENEVTDRASGFVLPLGATRAAVVDRLSSD